MNRVSSSLMAVVVLMFASGSDALFLDANISGVFTDSTFTTPAAGVTIAANGDTAEAFL